MGTNFNLQLIIPELLSNVPELEEAYIKMLDEEKSTAETLGKEDIRQLEQLAQLHNISGFDIRKPGVTIVFEQLLVRYIVDLSRDVRLHERLKLIIEWIETLANHPEFAVRNLIAVSVCEPLITTYEDTLGYFVPFMGEKTKALCTMQFEQYLISDETKKLFGIDD